MEHKVMNDFISIDQVTENMCTKYSGSVPNELVTIWREYGMGTLLGGYLKLINPDDFQDILEEGYFRSEVSIPIFATSMGDIITWEDNRYVRKLNYRMGTFEGIAAGFEFFLDDLASDYFKEKYFDLVQYQEAVERFGEPTYDECFGYIPLLALGGAEKVENLQKVKLREHILFISALAGPIQGVGIMESAFKIAKEISEQQYTSEDICKYLNSASISIVYQTLKEIAERSLQETNVLNEVKAIAIGEKEISGKGLGATTMSIIAIATLKELGDSTLFDSLDADDKNLVMGAFL
ncbi:T6SS immunity protein Tdi1 domain-containing protein [Listeria booriae]|uniref:T6SS immunity protein Tdi1 domain-containing protein n=1 Tax=Listeria booriae TaxID=1552123 RepID=UPI0028932FA8|nr:T6SS immunity protein Tdi1 domain-containing protein [Listeria booriae]